MGCYMLFYKDRSKIRTCDHVKFYLGDAVVEGDEVERWQLEEPGFMLLTEQYGRIMVNPGSADWEDVLLVDRKRGI